jgi:hypothetical protein
MTSRLTSLDMPEAATGVRRLLRPHAHAILVNATGSAGCDPVRTVSR